MLVIPYRLSLYQRRLPIITVAISCLSVFIFLMISDNHRAIANHAKQFCAAQAKTNVEGIKGTTIRVRGEERSCESVMTGLHLDVHANLILEDAVKEMNARNDRESAKRIRAYYKAFKVEAPPELAQKLEYHTWHFDVSGMFTSPFVHIEARHLLFNILFFLFLASALESLLGSGRFLGFIVALSYGDAIGANIHAIWVGDLKSIWGLSSLVYGCIGLSLVLLPHVKVRYMAWIGGRVGCLWSPYWIVLMVVSLWGIAVNFSLHDSESMAHTVSYLIGISIGCFAYGPKWARQQLCKSQNLAPVTDHESSCQLTPPTQGAGLVGAILVSGCLLALTFAAPKNLLWLLLLSLPSAVLAYHLYCSRFRRLRGDIKRMTENNQDC